MAHTAPFSGFKFHDLTCSFLGAVMDELLKAILSGTCYSIYSLPDVCVGHFLTDFYLRKMECSYYSYLYVAQVHLCDTFH